MGNIIQKQQQNQTGRSGMNLQLSTHFDFALAHVPAHVLAVQ